MTCGYEKYKAQNTKYDESFPPLVRLWSPGAVRNAEIRGLGRHADSVEMEVWKCVVVGREKEKGYVGR